MKRILVTIGALLLASPASAGEIQTVMVWHDSERAPVLDDYTFAPDTEVQVFDIAMQRQLDRQINAELLDRGLEFGPSIDENTQRTKDALRNYMGTPEFRALGEKFKALGYGLNAALSYEVDRVPTILFNERYRVVGVNSLEEAANVYHREVSE